MCMYIYIYIYRERERDVHVCFVNFKPSNLRGARACRKFSNKHNFENGGFRIGLGGCPAVLFFGVLLHTNNLDIISYVSGFFKRNFTCDFWCVIFCPGCCAGCLRLQGFHPSCTRLSVEAKPGVLMTVCRACIAASHAMHRKGRRDNSPFSSDCVGRMESEVDLIASDVSLDPRAGKWPRSLLGSGGAVGGGKQRYPLLFGVLGLRALDCLGFWGFRVSGFRVLTKW